jgi:BASS family bile acid:Na+ symporter
MPPLAHPLKRHLLPLLLVGCYVGGRLWPTPGVWLHNVDPLGWLPEVLAPSMAQLLVAVLLFAAALAVDWFKLAGVARRPLLFAASLAAVWLLPAALVLVGLWLLPQATQGETATALVAGFALVAAMPVANSAAGWTQQSRGDLCWCLALVVLSIVVAPWMVPAVLTLLGTSLAADQLVAFESLATQLAGVRFIVWVLLPTALGMLVRALVGGHRIDHRKPVLLVVSAVALLVLNYMNAAVALPRLGESLTIPMLAATLAASVVLCVAGQLAGRLTAPLASHDTAVAIGNALGMKHTGLALALAGGTLASQPVLIVPIIATTLIQHMVAGAFHAFCPLPPASQPQATDY